MGVEELTADPGGLPECLARLKGRFPDEICEASLQQGDAMAVVSSGALAGVMEFLKNDSRLLFNVLLDITAVDYIGREQRFEVVYHLLSMAHNRRLRIKVRLPGEKPSLDTVTGFWASANWLEREVWDMFGIEFRGHPELKRILLYPEFKGHPLRKDYPIRRRQPLVGPKG